MVRVNSSILISKVGNSVEQRQPNWLWDAAQCRRCAGDCTAKRIELSEVTLCKPFSNAAFLKFN